MPATFFSAPRIRPILFSSSFVARGDISFLLCNTCNPVFPNFGEFQTNGVFSVTCKALLACLKIKTRSARTQHALSENGAQPCLKAFPTA